MTPPRPKRCRECRRSVDMREIFVVSEGELVKIKPELVKASCPRCGSSFRWDKPHDVALRK